MKIGASGYNYEVISQSVAASGTYVLPDGFYFVICNTNTKVQIYNGTSWVDFTSTAGKTFVCSEGSIVRLYNGGTSAEASTLIKIVWV